MRHKAMLFMMLVIVPAVLAAPAAGGFIDVMGGSKTYHGYQPGLTSAEDARPFVGMYGPGVAAGTEVGVAAAEVGAGGFERGAGGAEHGADRFARGVAAAEIGAGGDYDGAGAWTGDGAGTGTWCRSMAGVDISTAIAQVLNGVLPRDPDDGAARSPEGPTMSGDPEVNRRADFACRIHSHYSYLGWFNSFACPVRPTRGAGAALPSMRCDPAAGFTNVAGPGFLSAAIRRGSILQAGIGMTIIVECEPLLDDASLLVSGPGRIQAQTIILQ